MSPRTVAQKMGVRPGSRAFVQGASDSALRALDLPDLERPDRIEGAFDHLHLFTTTQEHMRAHFPILLDHLAQSGMLWVSWPKGGRLGTDLTMKSVIEIGYDLAMVESTCLRVDHTWAALKFTRPKPGKTYRNSYGTLPRQRPDPT